MCPGSDACTRLADKEIHVRIGCMHPSRRQGDTCHADKEIHVRIGCMHPSRKHTLMMQPRPLSLADYDSDRCHLRCSTDCDRRRQEFMDHRRVHCDARVRHAQPDPSHSLDVSARARSEPPCARGKLVCAMSLSPRHLIVPVCHRRRGPCCDEGLPRATSPRPLLLSRGPHRRGIDGRADVDAHAHAHAPTRRD